MPGLEISIITAKFKTKAEEPQISRFFSKLLEHDRLDLIAIVFCRIFGLRTGTLA
jgi:hypothetical protein